MALWLTSLYVCRVMKVNRFWRKILLKSKNFLSKYQSLQQISSDIVTFDTTQLY